MEVVAGLSLRNLRPRVWDRRSPEHVPRLRAVMLSHDELGNCPAIYRRVEAGGFSAVIGTNAPNLKIYLDNGAFACLVKNREPAVEAYKRFVESTQPDWYPVPADFIPRPSDSLRRQRELFEKTVAVLEAHVGNGFCPVIHAGPWLGPYLDVIQRLGLTTQLAVGGLVPHLLNSAGAQRKQTIEALRGVRKAFPGTIHAFGIGGLVTLHLAAALGFDSADSSGWRQRAARGLIVLRARGERQAIQLGSWKGRTLQESEWAELKRCRCPACRRHGIEGLKSVGVHGFAQRAVHNLAMLLDEAALIERHRKAGDFPSWSRRRIRDNRMARLVELAFEVDA